MNIRCGRCFLSNFRMIHTVDKTEVVCNACGHTVTATFDMPATVQPHRSYHDALRG
jgi:ribosomal protein S27E